MTRAIRVHRAGGPEVLQWESVDVGVNRKDLVEGSSELFSLIGAGTIRISVNHRFPLRNAGLAHERLEARQTSGSTILIP